MKGEIVMKKIFTSLVSVLALALVARAADSTEFGVLKVPSSLSQTIVSVPWLESATNDTAVAVSNLVLTACLTAGDELLWYNPTEKKYAAWKLKAGEDSVLYWDSVTEVSISGVTVSAPADDATIARGQAIILVRQNPTTYGYFYIMGKPATVTETGAQSLPDGVFDAPVYTLIAPPTTGTIDFNDSNAVVWSNVGSNDYMTVSSTETYNWDPVGSQWYKYVKTGRRKKPTIVGVTNFVGQGVWYVSRGYLESSGNKSVNWK